MLATAPSSSPSPSSNPTSSHYTSSHRRSSYRPTANSTATIPPSPRSYPIRSTPSSSSSTKSNSSTPSTNLPFRSPKRPTRDAGTQYSPPTDWQPTSIRASSGQPAIAAPSSYEPSSQKAGAVTTPSSTTAQTILASQTQQPPQAHTAEYAPELVVPESVRSSLNKSSSSGDVFLDSDRSSPSKRSRPDAPPPRVMPRNFVDADPKELANVIADMLMELIRVNDEIPLQDGQLTRFHSRAAPGISVKDYMARLTYHASLPTPILLSMITYIDRLCAAFPIFRINSLTVHRFLITSATVASKGLSDSFWTNGTYSKIGGVSIKELALLELELLSRVDWRIIPSAQELDDYYRNLVGRCEGYVLANEGAMLDGSKAHIDEST